MYEPILKRPSVLLGSASSGGTIAALRHLAGHGVGVNVIVDHPFCAAGWSRYAARRYAGPVESDNIRYLVRLLAIGKADPGQVLLPSDVLDAFLLALGECLENVRRHSGVNEAHVTITDDETNVRAMVTDAGKGFDVATIDTGRLGFTESIVARLRDVGGNARLFSSPGSGTTVVLEVPK